MDLNGMKSRLFCPCSGFSVIIDKLMDVRFTQFFNRGDLIQDQQLSKDLNKPSSAQKIQGLRLNRNGAAEQQGYHRLALPPGTFGLMA